MRSIQFGRDRALWMAVALLLLVRLLSLGCYPLMDTTEARYGEIARKMAELGDWVTPWFDYGVPFWGKPPLAFWLSAGGIRLFGVNEVAVRLPHLLVGALAAWLVWRLGRRRDSFAAIAALVLLASSALFLVASGAVMTDIALALSCVLVMRGFWLALESEGDTRLQAAFQFFAGLALGLLAKGPLALVLAAIPLGLWTLVTRRWIEVWHSLPWLSGALLTALLALPWYWLAERHTPGFLAYFLLGEHWHRFLTPGWSGDLYGNGHAFARGSIWLFAVAATLPWSLLLPWAVWRWRGQAKPAPDRQWQLYLMLWGLAPCLLFTLAGNILWTYVLPGLPALALLGADWLARLPDRRPVKRLLLGGVAASTLLLILFVGHLSHGGAAELKSARALVADYSARAHGGEPLLFYRHRPYSGAFYSSGQAGLLRDVTALAMRIGWQPMFIAMTPRDFEALPGEVRRQLQPVSEHGRLGLYRAGPLLRLDAQKARP